MFSAFGVDLGKGEADSSILSGSTSFPSLSPAFEISTAHSHAALRVSLWQKPGKVCSLPVHGEW